MSSLITPYEHYTTFLVTQEKEIKGIRTGEEDIKLFFLMDDVIVYRKKFLKRINNKKFL